MCVRGERSFTFTYQLGVRLKNACPFFILWGPNQVKGGQMKKSLIVGALCMGLSFLTATVFASPVNLPTGIKDQVGLQIDKEPTVDSEDEYAQMINFLNKNIGISAGFLNDYVGERKLNKYSGKASFDMVGGEINMSIMKTVDIYTMLGGMVSPEIKGNVLNPSDKANLSNNFMWGVGASAVLYDWKGPGIQLFGDGNYRSATDIGIDSGSIDGLPFSKSDLSNLGIKASAKWQEWQAALGVSKKFKYIIPYGGVAYSDVRASAKFTALGNSFDTGTLSSKNKVGPFVGVSILPTKWLSIDVTGRFVAEEAVSVAATVKF